MTNIFFQLALILLLSSLYGVLMLKTKLPLVVAYLLAGVTLSFISLFDVGHSVVLEVLPEIGIAFVLFLIGMELNIKELKLLGKPIIITSVGQIAVSTLLGYLLARALGFGNSESIYLGLGLAFSSTVVVVKMLLEKRDISSLYGKLSVGILLIEDLVAIIALMLLTVGSSALKVGLQESLPLLTLVLKAIGLFVVTFILSKFVLDKVFKLVARSVELLFLTSICWCFIFTSLAILAGFSVVIGAFLAGVALASSPYHLQIEAKIKPIRDFFVALFFVYLGAQANLTGLVSAVPAILVFSLFAIILKPIIYLLLLSLFGFKKHTTFQTALNLSQVSEFSLVVLLVGVQMNLVSPLALSTMALVGVISIIVSSILIAKSRPIYKLLEPSLGFTQLHHKRQSVETIAQEKLVDHVIVIGAHRVGGPIIQYLSKVGIPLMVLDFNPNIVEELSEQGINAIYGDIGDPEILDYVNLETAKLVICTASDLFDNEILLEECKRRKIEAKIILRALDKAHVDHLKDLGADYVLLPEKVSGDFVVSQLKHYWPNVKFNELS